MSTHFKEPHLTTHFPVPQACPSPRSNGFYWILLQMTFEIILPLEFFLAALAVWIFKNYFKKVSRGLCGMYYSCCRMADRERIQWNMGTGLALFAGTPDQFGPVFHHAAQQRLKTSSSLSDSSARGRLRLLGLQEGFTFH